eukprot:2188908-Lingulodinium_polyedra.AAC.1
MLRAAALPLPPRQTSLRGSSNTARARFVLAIGTTRPQRGGPVANLEWPARLSARGSCATRGPWMTSLRLEG